VGGFVALGRGRPVAARARRARASSGLSPARSAPSRARAPTRASRAFRVLRTRTVAPAVKAVASAWGRFPGVRRGRLARVARASAERDVRRGATHGALRVAQRRRVEAGPGQALARVTHLGAGGAHERGEARVLRDRAPRPPARALASRSRSRSARAAAASASSPRSSARSRSSPARSCSSA
jgi:hypothetical protein